MPQRPTQMSAPSTIGDDGGVTPQSVRHRPRAATAHNPEEIVDAPDDAAVERDGWLWWAGDDPELEEEDPDKDIRERQDQEHETIFIGFGKVGFYSPMAYLSLPFRWEGSILPKVVPVMAAAAGVGALAHHYEWSLDPQMHSLLGFVLGFLLVILGNFSHSRYNSAIAAMNQMVQDGLSLSVEIFAHLRTAEMSEALVHTAEGVNRAEAFAKERAEFRRLILLYFRLACYEARKNRYTWLDPNGGVCTDDERFKFFVATDRWSQREWTYSHAGRLVPSLGCDDKSGRFMVTVRPSVVQTWIARRMCYYASIGVLGGNSAPLQAQLMTSIDQYTRHLSTFLTIDRTPMPFSYVQMTTSILLVFILTLPISLVDTLGKWTPLGGALFAYAYYGLYVNACQLCNPFNYDKTLTGVPINAFIQRLDALTGAALLDCNEAYGVEEDFFSPFSSIFKASAIEPKLKSPRSKSSRPASPSPRARRPGALAPDSSPRRSFTASFTKEPGVEATANDSQSPSSRPSPELGPADAGRRPRVSSTQEILPQSSPTHHANASPTPWLVGHLDHIDREISSEPPSPLPPVTGAGIVAAGRDRLISGSSVGIGGASNAQVDAVGTTDVQLAGP